MGRSKGIQISHWKVGEADTFKAIAPEWTNDELGISECDDTQKEYDDTQKQKKDE